MDAIKYVATLRTLAEQAMKQSHEHDNDRMRGYRQGRIEALAEVLELLKALEGKSWWERIPLGGGSTDFPVEDTRISSEEV